MRRMYDSVDTTYNNGTLKGRAHSGGRQATQAGHAGRPRRAHAHMGQGTHNIHNTHTRTWHWRGLDQTAEDYIT